MLDNTQHLLSAIELAEELSIRINTTINPMYIALSSFEDVIEPDSIAILENQ